MLIHGSRLLSLNPFEPRISPSVFSVPQRALQQSPTARGRTLSLENRGKVEITTVSKQPEDICSTPTAVYAAAAEDIWRRKERKMSDALRLTQGVALNDIDRVEAIRLSGRTNGGVQSRYREIAGDNSNAVEIKREALGRLRWKW